MALGPIRLDRLLRFEKITNADGTVDSSFQARWQSVMENIEESVNAVIEAQNAADAANAAAVAAQDAAESAQAAAEAAQATADGAQGNSSIASSGVSGCTILATDAGTDADIDISAHTRIYGDGTSVSVDGDTLTGLLYSTKYYIYYDQPSRAGGAVSYLTTTSQTTAAQTGNRHTVGSVTTPAGGGGPNPGVPNLAPGLT
jgi:hypothetical protein